MDDNLARAVQEKQAAGYPLDNTLFQNPQHGILYQNGEQVLDTDITDPTRLVTALEHLFAAPSAALENWHAAVAAFKEKVPALGRKAAELITEQGERTRNLSPLSQAFMNNAAPQLIQPLKIRRRGDADPTSAH